MQNIEQLELKRIVQTWRDRWCQEIPDTLEGHVPELKEQLLSAAEDAFGAALLIPGSKARKNMKQITQDWLQLQSRELLGRAMADLSNRLETALTAATPVGMDFKPDGDALGHVAAGSVAGLAGLVLLPFVGGLSTSTVSAGGIAGFFGATLTVLNPIGLTVSLTALAASVGVTLFGFGKGKQKLKAGIERTVDAQVLYGMDPRSYAWLLTDCINDAANKLLDGELQKHAQ